MEDRDRIREEERDTTKDYQETASEWYIRIQCRLASAARYMARMYLYYIWMADKFSTADATLGRYCGLLLMLLLLPPLLTADCCY